MAAARTKMSEMVFDAVIRTALAVALLAVGAWAMGLAIDEINSSFQLAVIRPSYSDRFWLLLEAGITIWSLSIISMPGVRDVRLVGSKVVLPISSIKG